MGRHGDERLPEVRQRCHHTHAAFSRGAPRHTYSSWCTPFKRHRECTWNYMRYSLSSPVKEMNQMFYVGCFDVCGLSTMHGMLVSSAWLFSWDPLQVFVYPLWLSDLRMRVKFWYSLSFGSWQERATTMPVPRSCFLVVLIHTYEIMKTVLGFQ